MKILQTSVATRNCLRTIRHVFTLLALLRCTADSSALSLSGVTEGSKLVLPPFASTTNLTLTAVPGPGSTDIALWLEANGAVLRQMTIGAPFSVTFSNLPVGKYYLTAQTINNPSDSADISFDIQPAPFRPANDAREQASTIITMETPVVGTNTFASAEFGEPVHAQNGSGRSIWWKWQSDSARTISATTVGSSFDTVLGVYTLTDLSNLVVVAANDDSGLAGPFSQVTFPALAGTTYLIAVDGALSPDGTVATGRVELHLSTVLPPAVTFLSPTNGFARLVPSPSATADVGISMSVSDPSGIARVDFQLDGPGIKESGTLSSPYQTTLSHLPPGDYLLSLHAENTAGLVAGEHASFSIINAAPKIHLLERFSAVVSAFGFGVTGLKGSTYELQAAADLASWSRLAIWTNFDGALHVSDTNAGLHPTRFYRVMTP